MDRIGEERLQILNGCIEFFNTIFTNQVLELTQQVMVRGPPKLVLEDSIEIRRLRFTKEETHLVTYTSAQAKALNTQQWRWCGGKLA